MTLRLRAQLVVHGAIVIFLGLLARFPFLWVITGTLAGEERAWRMAHLEGVLNGLVVLAGAGVAPLLTLSLRQQQLLAGSLIGMAYGNVVASILGASFGVRGLALGGSFANSLVFLLFMVAIAGIFMALWLLIQGARHARE